MINMANFLLKHSVSRFFTRSFSSALYITGDKAHETFKVLTPHIDFEERIKNKVELEENVRSRGLNIDVGKIEKYWHFYKTIDDTKHVLEITKNEIGHQISKLLKEPEKNSKEINRLKVHAKLVKDDLKNVKEYLYGIEEHAVENVLSLPNGLHEKTPRESPCIVHTFLEKDTEKSKHHADIAAELGLAEVIGGKLFLKNEAALFELAAQNYFETFLSQHNYIPFSNSDFVRSVVVEGCGTDFRSKSDILTLENKHDDKNHELSRLHLAGGASHYSFMAYYTKHFVQSSYFPLKHYAAGRKYKPVTSDDRSFFNLEQETAIEIFVATPNCRMASNEMFEEILSMVVRLYESLGYHFRLVYLPANQLNRHECLRLSVEMYSNHSQSYVEVASVSMCDDYLSKRLLFTYNEGKEKKFPCVISGTLLSVQKLLACVLEQSSVRNESVISSVLAPYVP